MKKVISKEQLDSALKMLKSGECMLVQALKTKSPSKLRLEFAEKTRGLEGDAGALTALFNASDSRFSSGARRAWKTAEIVDLMRIFPDINFGDDADWEDETTEHGTRAVLRLGITKPQYSDLNFRVIINETTVPDEYQADNIEETAKRRGAEGEYITYKGKYIFSNTDVVLLPEGKDPEHVLLAADAMKEGVETDHTVPVRNDIVDETM